MQNETNHDFTKLTADPQLQPQQQSNNNMHELYIQIIMQHKKQQTFLPFNLVLHLAEISTLLSASLSCFSSTTNTPSYTLDEELIWWRNWFFWIYLENPNLAVSYRSLYGMFMVSSSLET